jgi:hypothetical protein
MGSAASCSRGHARFRPIPPCAQAGDLPFAPAAQKAGAERAKTVTSMQYAALEAQSDPEASTARVAHSHHPPPEMERASHRPRRAVSSEALLGALDLSRTRGLPRDLRHGSCRCVRVISYLQAFADCGTEPAD